MATPLSSRDTLARMQKGLRMVTVPFPHLSGLVAAARAASALFITWLVTKLPFLTARRKRDDAAAPSAAQGAA